VRVDQYHALLHQGSHARGVARVVGEHQERAAVGYEAAVQRDAVHDRGHAELAHAVVQVVAGHLARRDRLVALEVGVVRPGEVRGPAKQFWQRGTEHVKDLLRRDARGNCSWLLDRGVNELLQLLAPAGRQLAAHAALEFGREFRVGLRIGGYTVAPRLLRGGAGISSVPGLPHLGRNHERLVRPVDVLARCRHFRVAERSSMHAVRARLVGRAPADDGLAADQRWLLAFGLCGLNGPLDGDRIVSIHVTHHVPAIGLEPPRRVVGEPAVDLTIDRDAVVVVEAGQLAELERSGKRAGLVRHAFHQAAIADENPRPVVDHLVARAVERCGEKLLRKRHAHGVGEALAQRAGGGLDAEVRLDLGMARGVRAELTEVLQLLEVERIARQVQQRVKQHRTVAVRQHEAVAIDPLRVAGVVLEVVGPQHLGDVGHAHRHARVPGVGFLDRIHAQRADRVGELPAGRHE